MKQREALALIGAAAAAAGIAKEVEATPVESDVAFVVVRYPANLNQKAIADFCSALAADLKTKGLPPIMVLPNDFKIEVQRKKQVDDDDEGPFRLYGVS